MVTNLQTLILLLSVCITSALIIVDLNPEKAAPPAVCHQVHVRKCDLQLVEERVPRIRDVCWKEIK